MKLNVDLLNKNVRVKKVADIPLEVVRLSKSNKIKNLEADLTVFDKKPSSYKNYTDGDLTAFFENFFENSKNLSFEKTFSQVGTSKRARMGQMKEKLGLRTNILLNSDNIVLYRESLDFVLKGGKFPTEEPNDKNFHIPYIWENLSLSQKIGLCFRALPKGEPKPNEKKASWDVDVSECVIGGNTEILYFSFKQVVMLKSVLSIAKERSGKLLQANLMKLTQTVSEALISQVDTRNFRKITTSNRWFFQGSEEDINKAKLLQLIYSENTPMIWAVYANFQMKSFLDQAKPFQKRENPKGGKNQINDIPKYDWKVYRPECGYFAGSFVWDYDSKRLESDAFLSIEQVLEIGMSFRYDQNTVTLGRKEMNISTYFTTTKKFGINKNKLDASYQDRIFRKYGGEISKPEFDPKNLKIDTIKTEDDEATYGYNSSFGKSLKKETKKDQ